MIITFKCHYLLKAYNWSYSFFSSLHERTKHTLTSQILDFWSLVINHTCSWEIFVHIGVCLEAFGGLVLTLLYHSTSILSIEGFGIFHFHYCSSLTIPLVTNVIIRKNWKDTNWYTNYMHNRKFNYKNEEIDKLWLFWWKWK